MPEDAPTDIIPADAGEIERRVRVIGEEIERARFAGASPRIELAADHTLDDAIARALAADRFGAPLIVGGQIHHLHEERAEEGLRSAQAAQQAGRFGEARSRLDRAAGIAADPALQQRLGLWKLLVALAERLVRTPPEEGPGRDPSRPALDALDGADLLPDAERQHYHAEVGRLIETHTSLRVDPTSPDRALWYVVRARQALTANEPLAALTFCVQLGRVLAMGEQTAPAAESYLGESLDKARLVVLLALGEIHPDDVEAAQATTKDLQAWDVYRALVAHVSTAFGLDAQREVSRFTVEPYRDADA